ncbi:hypothetical protein EXIGLDRAFT_720669 [Exidia glandulosa HHB12029]|uniref:Uncharacterized protein n=1 Tax=Exidia glandulosa HHB12029 TaxID=1314781 RepID=A0A165G7I0_EXIGL|nr:hypothetical protein EXIGLDRAFT_720669 [Exidia glandulosa HHB12029]
MFTLPAECTVHGEAGTSVALALVMSQRGFLSYVILTPTGSEATLYGISADQIGREFQFAYDEGATDLVGYPGLELPDCSGSNRLLVAQLGLKPVDAQSDNLTIRSVKTSQPSDRVFVRHNATVLASQDVFGDAPLTSISHAAPITSSSPSATQTQLAASIPSHKSNSASQHFSVTTSAVPTETSSLKTGGGMSRATILEVAMGASLPFTLIAGLLAWSVYRCLRRRKALRLTNEEERVQPFVAQPAPGSSSPPGPKAALTLLLGSTKPEHQETAFSSSSGIGSSSATTQQGLPVAASSAAIGDARNLQALEAAMRQRGISFETLVAGLRSSPDAVDDADPDAPPSYSGRRQPRAVMAAQ